MKNITLSADEDLIKRARVLAGQQNRTLNDAFREWLRQFAGGSRAVADYQELMADLNYVNAGRHFTRDELNER